VPACSSSPIDLLRSPPSFTGYPPEVAETFAQIRLDADLPVAHVARARKPLWLGDQHAWRERYPHMAVPQAADDAHAVAALPLQVGDQVVGGVLALSFPTERRFPPEERAFATALTGQAAQALDRAASADARRQVADTLQRGLLPAVCLGFPGWGWPRTTCPPGATPRPVGTGTTSPFSTTTTSPSRSATSSDTAPPPQP
jgi:hypothetical protein